MVYIVDVAQMVLCGNESEMNLYFLFGKVHEVQMIFLHGGIGFYGWIYGEGCGGLKPAGSVIVNDFVGNAMDGFFFGGRYVIDKDIEAGEIDVIGVAYVTKEYVSSVGIGNLTVGRGARATEANEGGLEVGFVAKEFGEGANARGIFDRDLILNEWFAKDNGHVEGVGSGVRLPIALDLIVAQ